MLFVKDYTCVILIGNLYRQRGILKPTAYWSPYIFKLVQKVKRRVYKIHIFLSEAILCRDSASYFI